MQKTIHCPIKADFELAASSGRIYLKALRRLRKAMRACQECVLLDDCPIRREINRQIDEAIQEVTAEWGLTERPVNDT